MKEYMAISNKQGMYLTSKEQAIQALNNGALIFLDNQIVATNIEEVEKLDFEPCRPAGSFLLEQEGLDG